MDEIICPNFGSVITINVQNKNNQKMEVIYNARDHMKNILSYVDFANMCQLVKYFPQLNPHFWKEDITFPLSSSSGAIEWRKHLNEFESGLSIIDTRTYFDFTIDKNNSGETVFIQ